MKYTLASEIFKEQFDQVCEVIAKTLAYLKEHTEMEVFLSLQEVANDILDCFKAEYDEIRANDSYQISDAAENPKFPLMEFWKEQVEQYNIEAIMA